MEFLTKIENLINGLILKLGELIMDLFKRITPPVVKKVIGQCRTWANYLTSNFKSLPKILKELVFNWVKQGKVFFASIDIRAKLVQNYKTALAQYQARNSKGLSAVKGPLMAPFLLLGQWLQGLTTAQSMLLLTFSAASFLAGINIIFSGHRIMRSHTSDLIRGPASIEEELKYERPEYYKKENRHALVTNFRLPVYFAEVNQINSVDIDFNVTLSNRQSRIFLEKHEFQIRDHLIVQIEPLIANFPLEDEGKEVLKEKIWKEIDDFLKKNNVNGHVEELKVTYILAN